MTRRVLPLAFGTLMVWITGVSAQTLPSTLSADALALACAPRASFKAPETKLTVSGSLTDAQGVFAPWHRLVIGAGSDEGIKAGEEYYVRRLVPMHEAPGKGEKAAHAIMTMGWIHIDQLQTHRSIASVVHACGGFEPGDYLEPFSVPAVPTPLPPGSPDFSEPGMVLFTRDRGSVAGSGAMVTIDRGSDQGIRPGQHMTIYRATASGPNVIVARGIAVLVQADTSTLKIEDMRDAVMRGDLVAPHK